MTSIIKRNTLMIKKSNRTTTPRYFHPVVQLSYSGCYSVLILDIEMIQQ